MSWKRMISSHLRFLDCDKVKRGICFNLIPEWVFCSPTSFSYRASYFKQGRKLIIPFHVPQDQPTFFGWVFFQPKTQFSNQRTWVLCDWRNSHVLVSHDPFYQRMAVWSESTLTPQTKTELSVGGCEASHKSTGPKVVVPKNHVLGCNKRPLRVSRGCETSKSRKESLFFSTTSTQPKKNMANNQIRLLVFSCSDCR